MNEAEKKQKKLKRNKKRKEKEIRKKSKIKEVICSQSRPIFRLVFLNFAMDFKLELSLAKWS